MYFAFYFIFLIFIFVILFFTLLIKETLKTFHLWSIQKRTCRRGNKRFDVHLRRIGTVHFLSKDGKSASYDGRDGWKSCLFPARVGIFNFDVLMSKVFFPYLYFDWAGKQLCFPSGESINRRNENTGHSFLFLFC